MFDESFGIGALNNFRQLLYVQAGLQRFVACLIQERITTYANLSKYFRYNN